MKDKFPDSIYLKDAGMIKGSRVFIIEKPFKFQSSKGLIVVPKGFVTDGASIPKIFHNIIGPYGSYFPAALIHDYLYSSLNEQFTREESDELFLEGMESLGVSWITRKTIYRSVRLFGWQFYRGYND